MDSSSYNYQICLTSRFKIVQICTKIVMNVHNFWSPKLHRISSFHILHSTNWTWKSNSVCDVKNYFDIELFSLILKSFYQWNFCFCSLWTNLIVGVDKIEDYDASEVRTKCQSMDLLKTDFIFPFYTFRPVRGALRQTISFGESDFIRRWVDFKFSMAFICLVHFAISVLV